MSVFGRWSAGLTTMSACRHMQCHTSLATFRVRSTPALENAPKLMVPGIPTLNSSGCWMAHKSLCLHFWPYAQLMRAHAFKTKVMCLSTAALEYAPKGIPTLCRVFVIARTSAQYARRRYLVFCHHMSSKALADAETFLIVLFECGCFDSVFE